MKKTLPLLCLVFVWLGSNWIFSAAPEQNYAGIWQGKLKIQGTELRLIFRIQKEADDSYSATFDSPDQGAENISMDSAEVVDGQIVLTFKQAGLQVIGRIQPEGQQMLATLKQAGMELPLELKRVEKVEKPNRPQLPQKPYPYKSDEVTYQNEKAGITISGTITLPEGAGPFPAVLLITGSGAQDRDESIFEHKPFLVLADYLTRQGIAVLRCDDRGMGGTTGNLGDSTTAELAQDALAGVTFLKERKEIDPLQIGLIGHSEGGIIAPLAATQSKDIAFIVLLAGTGLTGEEILYMQGELLSRAMGVTEEKIQESRIDQERIYAVLKQNMDVESMEKELRRMYEQAMTKLSEEERKEEEVLEAGLEAQLKQVLSPWFRYFLTYDPRPALQRVKCPVLALNGEKDLQVPPKENLAEIAKALKKGGNRDVTTLELPGLNHLFQTAETGATNEYGKIEETFAPSALKILGDWIRERVGLTTKGLRR
jgi:pimeloyl-ACP methyl ester carboxylesterase